MAAPGPAPVLSLNQPSSPPVRCGPVGSPRGASSATPGSTTTDAEGSTTTWVTSVGARITPETISAGAPEVITSRIGGLRPGLVCSRSCASLSMGASGAGTFWACAATIHHSRQASAAQERTSRSPSAA